ncbi:MAG: glycosyl hydrolase family protein [Sphingobacteriales bacterium]|nr:MAG: glycosyl hydrolase family protein [Sphingobacteriales bacterium]
MDNSKSLPAIWAGMECTISRVGDDFHDQLQCGSYYDKDYLQPVLDLNVSAIRFPVLWEKHEPEQGATIDWTWAREQLGRIRHKGIEPIVGLLHHGSGPAFTSLADKAMPYYFADYAAKVAQAFPWVNYYTPVNEPLTTARFSGLYGHWYPHKKSDRHFLNMLINQLKATVLGMQAIRAINPAAKLIQTEDLGKTYSCSTLQYQSAFENQRRWLSFDLLCGKVDQKHVLYPYLVRNGVAVSDIEFFVQHPCPPAMIGANYYVTSERYLDCNLDGYPQDTHGGNGIHAYADVEAARVPLTAANGPAVLLTELWERYEIPIAITEVQLHCSREEQLRWFKFIHETALTLQHSGVDIRAVTAWAVLGSFGWDKLLTCKSMQYESGAFDISAGYCRITALGRLIQEIAQTGASQSYGPGPTHQYNGAAFADSW